MSAPLPPLPDDPPLRVITSYSPSHRGLFEEMIATFPWEAGVEFSARVDVQDGDGTFLNPGWGRATARKMDYLHDVLTALPEDTLLLWTDVDIVYFRPVRADLIRLLRDMRAEMLFQNDAVELCAGFFVLRKTPATLALIESVRRKTPEFGNDQAAMNQLIAGSGVRYGLLPRRYFNLGLDLGLWDGSAPVRIPKNAVLFHANWTHGFANKHRLMTIGREFKARRAAEHAGATAA